MACVSHESHISLLTWYNLIFRGTALAQKTQVMFFGFWWKSGFSAVRPGKSATRRGWTTWCSYPWPWRRQLTKVLAPAGSEQGASSHVRTLEWDVVRLSCCRAVWRRPGRCLLCMPLLIHSSGPMWLSLEVFTEPVMEGTYFRAYKFQQHAGLESV